MVLALGDYLQTDCHACVGGTRVSADVDKLRSGVHIVVGTPGRVYDMISRGALRLNSLKMFVLDEADEMLSRGFKEQIYDVFKNLPAKVQVVLLSATMAPDVLEVTTRFMRDPIRILVKKDELTLEGIKQFYIAVVRRPLSELAHGSVSRSLGATLDCGCGCVSAEHRMVGAVRRDA